MNAFCVSTARFGAIDAAPEDVFRFPRGLVGFEHLDRWLLLAERDSSTLGWLQSIDAAEVALPVVDPHRFHAQFSVTVSRTDLSDLDLPADRSAVVLAIVTKDARGLGMNLQAPLLLNLATRRGAQIICRQAWPLRFPIRLETGVYRKTA